jgi:hypothetical protein
MHREENRGYEVVKNGLVEESEERFFEKYDDKLQLAVEYPKGNRGELRIKED